jgi:hypothetical protein
MGQEIDVKGNKIDVIDLNINKVIDMHINSVYSVYRVKERRKR